MIGRKIMKKRETNGLSRKELSERSGVATSFIYAIENGQKSPTVRTLEKLALALEISINDLLTSESGYFEDKPA